MAFMLAAGDQLVHWRKGLREVKPGMSTGLLRWFRDQVDRFLSHRGFDIAQALREAMELSQGTLPIFVLCGALQPSVMGYVDTEASDAGGSMTSRIIQQISDAQQEVAEKRLRSVFTQPLAATHLKLLCLVSEDFLALFLFVGFPDAQVLFHCASPCSCL
jgi:hypothetical protein